MFTDTDYFVLVNGDTAYATLISWALCVLLLLSPRPLLSNIVDDYDGGKSFQALLTCGMLTLHSGLESRTLSRRYLASFC